MVRAKLTFIILVTSTIFSVMSLPFNNGDISDKSCPSRPGHVFVMTDKGVQCISCNSCPHGKGLSVKCDGQFIPSTVSVHCVDCVSGKNFSESNNYKQCQPCKICLHQEVVGDCVKFKDRQSCVPCNNDTYYSYSDMKCMPCHSLCENISLQVTCLENGFDFNKMCEKPPVTAATTVTDIMTKSLNNTIDRRNEDGDAMKLGHIIVIILVVVCVALVISVYCGCVGKNIKKIVVENTRWPVGQDDWLSVFCWCFVKTVDLCSQAINIEEIVSGTTVDIPQQRPVLERQHSEPVTQREKKDYTCNTENLNGDLNKRQHDTIHEARSSDNLLKECKREHATLDDINPEWCRTMYFGLDNADPNLSFSYVTLAGNMGCTSGQVKEFEATKNPTKSLLVWFFEKPENNVLKLIKLFESMGRERTADGLEKERKKIPCECPKCC